MAECGGIHVVCWYDWSGRSSHSIRTRAGDGFVVGECCRRHVFCGYAGAFDVKLGWFGG
jgi:hypothetical protein